VGVEWVGGLLRAFLLFVVLTRGGLLALAVAFYVEFSIHESRLTLDPTAWYSTLSLPVFLVVVGLAVYAFRTALAGKAPFGQLLADD
jgi:hypothetical protein